MEKPYTKRLENWIETFNELCILGCCYTEMILLNTGEPLIFLVKIGNSFMIIGMCNVLVNVIIFVMKLSSDLIGFVIWKHEDRRKM